MMSTLWSVPQTRDCTTVHTIAVLNKSVWANSDKGASFIFPPFPFIPPAAVKEKCYKLQANAPIAFWKW